MTEADTGDPKVLSVAMKTVDRPPMTGRDHCDDAIDWRPTTWDGARFEALRRWAKLPLERLIAAQQEMAEFGRLLARTPSRNPTTPRDRGSYDPLDQAETKG